MGTCPTTRPVYRLGTVISTSEFSFLYNNGFKILAGQEHFVNGELCFPTGADQKLDGTYRTRFGPCISHSAVMYRDTDVNVRLALQRLTNSLFNDLDDAKEYGFNDLQTANATVIANQDNFLWAHDYVYEELRREYSVYFNIAQDAYTEGELHHADPHVKKSLRLQSWKEMHEDGGFCKRLWLRNVTYKMKKAEYAKNNKRPRMIGDLGVAASLQGFMLTKYLKSAQAGYPLYINGGLIMFVPNATVEELTKAFDLLINLPALRFCFCYFSDDSCYSVRIRDEIKMYNVDISSCDSSHTKSLFDLFISMFPEFFAVDAQVLVDQCKLPIIIFSSVDRSRQVKMTPRQPRLYSGSTMTTCINNLASQAIGIAFSEMPVNCDNIENMRAAALRVGYKITIDPCVNYSHLQFLKNSPVYDTSGTLRPVLNFGVFLRASGTCFGDLPGRGPIEQRARHFQTLLLQGMYPNCNVPLISGMRDCVVPSTKLSRAHATAFKQSLKRVLPYAESESSEVHFDVTDTEFLKRYDLGDLEDILIADLTSMTVMEELSSEPCAMILNKDYGLGVRYENDYDSPELFVD